MTGQDVEQLINWGPSGQVVYERTYSRPKPDGTKELWPETVIRVVDGNLNLVDPKFINPGERDQLIELMTAFKILPAGRHLWASGVKGRQYLFNCHVAGWDANKFSTHFEFTFMRLMEGGGVGANYSQKYLSAYRINRALAVHIVCDPNHPDYAKLQAAGVLSTDFTSDWHGAYEVGDSREGWAAAFVDLLDTFTTRANVEHTARVFDITNVRPEGARLKTFGGTASGPLPFAKLLHDTADTLNGCYFYNDGYVTGLDAMAIDHAIGECVVAGGNRRSARMSIMHWADPDIYDFINCKSDTGEHWTTNISVEIDDTFFACLEAYNNGSKAIEDFRAFYVMRQVTKAMLANGEPGFWNSSLSNHGEPVEVICTNPCGEIALTEWENCNLGHINLDAFYDDRPGAMAAHRLMARFLIRATFGDVNDPKQAARLASQRRIGVGHFGLQGMVTKQGFSFTDAANEDTGLPLFLSQMKAAVRAEARDYAFQLRIPEPVKVTTVAPTGTIAKLAGRTEGIHPIFARYFIRRIRFSLADPAQRDQVAAFKAQGFQVEHDQYAANTMVVSFPTKESLVSEVEALGFNGSIVESVDELSVETMLKMQAIYQTYYADNAVSFTVNVDPGKVTAVELQAVLEKYLPVLKGTTVFPEMSRPQSPYERITQADYESAANQTVADGVDENCFNGSCPVR